MAAVDATAVSQEELEAKAWEGFTEGNWQKDIDVRDFIQKNYTPYEGDASFLADATDKTMRVCGSTLDDELPLRGAQGQRVLRRRHPHPGRHRRLPGPATSIPRRSTT